MMGRLPSPRNRDAFRKRYAGATPAYRGSNGVLQFPRSGMFKNITCTFYGDRAVVFAAIIIAARGEASAITGARKRAT